MNEPDEPALKGGGGGGTSDGMVPIKDYIDARDEAIETRLMSKLDSLATKDTIRNNVWGGVAAMLAVLLGIAAFGGDRFDAGIGLSGDRQAQLVKDERQDRQAASIDEKLDRLLAAQKAPPR